MILIADCGGSKVAWSLLDGDTAIKEFTTPGMNVLMLSYQQMQQRLGQELAPRIKDYEEEITNVYFYGAGCVSEEVCRSVGDALLTAMPDAIVEVASDMLGTCRALCGDTPGIVCIMGTGSNSCYYDGSKIADNVSPLGYILGDEGSGAVLGKTLVGDVLKRQLPEPVIRKFQEQYELTPLEAVRRVYREPHPNKYLASFCPFLKENIDEPSVRSLVLRSFKAFFKRNVALYAQAHDCGTRVYFSGSIAYYFSALLAEAAAWAGFEIAKTVREPMEGLKTYHTSPQP